MGRMSYNSIKHCMAILLTLAVLLLGHAPAWASFADNPLNSASGASTIWRTDLTLGKTFPIAITRQYNSKSGFVGPMGHGWALTYDKQLYTYPDGSVIIRASAGRRSKFPAAAGGFTSPLTDTGTLTLNTDGTYTYTALDGTREHYDTRGRLASITDPKGTSLVFTYESASKSPITGLLPWNVDQTNPTVVAYAYHLSRIDEMNAAGTATGKWITFGYDATSGMLATLSDSLGRTITFTHDAIGNLTSVTGPGIAATYGYSDPNNKHLMTSIDEGHGTFVNTYDSVGRVTQQVHGNTTIAVAYTTPGQLTTVTTTVTDASGHVLTTDTRTVAFDSLRQVISDTDTQGNQIKYTRNSQTWITRKEWWQNTGTVATPNLVLDHAIDYTYDAKGNILTQTEPNGITTYTYDVAGNILTMANPLNQTSSYTYNSANQLLTMTGPQGTVSNSYDANGNLVTATDPAGGTTTYGYDANGNLATITNANNQTTTNTYDANDNLASVTDPTGVKTSYTYDINGNLLTITDATGKTTTNSYDTMNRLVKVTDPLNHITTYSYDANGNRSAVTDANGNSTIYSYNDQGQVVTVKDALDNITTYTYGGSSGTGCPSCGGSGGNNLIGLTDAKGQTTSFQYDFMNRLTQESDPLQKVTSYAYDTAGNLAAKADANGASLAYIHDSLKRLTGITYPDGSTVTYTYDPAGRIQSAANGNITYTYGYDAANRITSVSDSRGYTITYQYDTLGNRTQMNVLANTADQRITSYSYDKAGRLQSITSTAGLFTFGYDAAGRRSSLNYPNLVTAAYGYDEAGRLTSLVHQGTGQPIASFSYTLDNVGNRTAKSGTVTENYIYDLIYRLITVTSSTTEAFTYDPVGNRVTGPAATDTGYLYNAGNQTTQDSKYQYSYDNNGNQTARVNPSDPNKSWTLTWDYENRLVRMDNTATQQTLTFKYDPMGRRIEKKVTAGTSTSTYSYLYDNDAIAMEMLTDDSGTSKTFYTHGLNIDEPLALERSGLYYYYHADGLGSIAAISDQSANVVQSYLYSSFGNVTASTDFRNSFAYTGREWDKETGLYYYRARYYDPMEGRFISKDPAGHNGGINLYGYVGQNPINYGDPSGLKPGDKFNTIELAVTDALKFAMPLSKANFSEYGGWILKTDDCKYTYHYPIKGEPRKIPAFPDNKPANAADAWYHTHLPVPFYVRVDPTKPSGSDQDISNNTHSTGYIGYEGNIYIFYPNN
ncbi:MAG: hypothetical protein CXR31_00300 [Geobacter sp.]|nr:MAG: hypothetical protein CXR31_00300 [Geobacter sp.]